MKKWVKRTLGGVGIAAAVGAATLLKVETKKSTAQPAIVTNSRSVAEKPSKESFKPISRGWSVEKYLRQNISDMKEAGFFHKDDNVVLKVVDYSDDKVRSVEDVKRPGVLVKSAWPLYELARAQSNLKHNRNFELIVPFNYFYNAPSDEEIGRELNLYSNVYSHDTRVATSCLDLANFHVRALKANNSVAPLSEDEVNFSTMLDKRALPQHKFFEAYRSVHSLVHMSSSDSTFSGSDGTLFEVQEVKREGDDDSYVTLLVHDAKRKRSFVAVAQHTLVSNQSNDRKWLGEAREGLKLLVHDAHLALKER